MSGMVLKLKGAWRTARYADARISHLDGVSVDYDDWHFNVRPSNTEPLLPSRSSTNAAVMSSRVSTSRSSPGWKPASYRWKPPLLPISAARNW